MRDFDNERKACLHFSICLASNKGFNLIFGFETLQFVIGEFSNPFNLLLSITPKPAADDTFIRKSLELSTCYF